MNENLLECYLCHEHKDPWETLFTDLVIDGKYRPVCNTCFEEKYFTCTQCNNNHKVEDKIVHDGKTYCKECFNSIFFICNECHTVTRRGEAHSVGNNQFICTECYRQGEILSNSYKPDPKFKLTEQEKKHERFMGVELEIDGGDNPSGLSKAIYKLANKDSYNKHDGSLRSGFEIVTHPMSLNYHKEVYPWEKIMKKAVSEGFKSHKTKTCGLHVHLNRKAFGANEATRDFNIMKTIIFFENNWDKLVNFSRRRPEALNSWARRFGVYSDVEKQADWEYHYKNCKGDGNRYHAVNLTNKNTIEIRIFRGSLVPSTLFAALELLDLLMIKLPQLSFEQTIHYNFKSVIEDAKQLSYTNLLSYCNDRKINEEVSKFVSRLPKAGETVEITGRVFGFPERSGRIIGNRGIVSRLRSSDPAQLEEDSGGVLVRFSFGEYWCRPSSLRICSPTDEVEEEDSEERKFN